jgi:tRNA-specific 2-thiouridylase
MAASLGLRTAAKPDSQDVCFITTGGGREAFLARRIPFTPGVVVDTGGRTVGHVDAVELLTVGQRRGLTAGGGERRYVVAIDPVAATVTVGGPGDLLTGELPLRDLRWAGDPAAGAVLVQCSAHGPARPADVDGTVVRWAEPQRRVAPGQTVVLYDPTDQLVLGGGIAVSSSPSAASLRLAPDSLTLGQSR